MALLTISQASKDWHTSRSRLYQLNKAGKLSFTKFPDGKPAVDTAELTRAIGEPKNRRDKVAPEDHDTIAQLDAEFERAVKDDMMGQIRALQAQNEALQRERDGAIEDKARLLGILENQTRLLQGPTTPVVSLENSPIMRLLLTKLW